MNSADRVKAAEWLLSARRNRARVPGFHAALRPRSLAEAYAIQVEVMRLRDERLAGFKIGLTSPEAQRAAGASEPIAGRLAAADVLRSPARIVLCPDHLRVVEAEVVFRIGRELQPRHAPFAESAVLDSIDGAFASIEICDSRFEHSDTLTLAQVVADNGNADRLILGERLEAWRAFEFTSLPVALTRRHASPVNGSPARVLGHPVKALTWLANWLSARGESLEPGHLVATGTCTGMEEAAVDDVVEATFGSQARASVELLIERAREAKS